MRTPIIYLTLFFLFPLLIGCSNNGLKVNKVEGKVTWNGTPVDGAVISFLPAVDGPDVYIAFGTTDDQGDFVLTSQASEFGSGAVAGSYKVIIAKPQPGGIGRPSRTSQIPGQYAEATQTPLTVEVVRGKNTFNFELEGKAPSKAPVDKRSVMPPPGPHPMSGQ